MRNFVKEGLIKTAFLLSLLLIIISFFTGEAKMAESLEFKIPQPIKAEHEELHAKLAKAAAMSGKMGEAAREVARVLQPHFEREEEYALPPLGLLPILAEGKVAPDMERALVMSDRLKAELPRMLDEHKAIVAELKNLTEAARKEDNTEYIRFAQALILHAQMEEEVLYPASILVGEYLKLKFHE